VQGALVPVRETEEHGGGKERGQPPDAPFEEVLEPSAEEELFRHCDEEEGEEKCSGKS